MIAVLVGISFLINCNIPRFKFQDSAEIKNNLINELRKDTLITSYWDVVRRIDDGIASNEFNLSHYNKALVEKGRKDCHTSDEVIALYEKAGVTHARQYLALKWREFGIVVLIQKKYSELYKLPIKEREEIFKATLPKMISIQPKLDSIVTHAASLAK